MDNFIFICVPGVEEWDSDHFQLTLQSNPHTEGYGTCHVYTNKLANWIVSIKEGSAWFCCFTPNPPSQQSIYGAAWTFMKHLMQ